jgi:hypothetical protein
MIGLLILIGAVLVLALVFWYGLRGAPNEGPALGHNLPYPASLMPPVGSRPEIVEEDEPTGGQSQMPQI